MTEVLNRPWRLQSFLDSLIVELDRARDTLAVKALTRPLSYSVKDLDLELQIFPQFDGREVRFVTARPGEQGASGLKIQLGSITARSIKETTSEPITTDDVSIELLDGIDEETKDSLARLGVKSGKDLERLEERDVDLEKVTNQKLDYGDLANVIKKARRGESPPTVSRVALGKSAGGEGVLTLEGENLVTSAGLAGFPLAMLDGERVEVLAASDRGLRLLVEPDRLVGGPRRLEVALDPFAVLTMRLRGDGGSS
jgi:hypothetical protein